MNRLPLIAKIVASLVALAPGILGAVVFWQAKNYHEPDPGPGNMPSFFPFALVGMALGVLLVVWSLPQLAFLASVWRGRARAFFTLAVLAIIQGTVPALLFVLSIRGPQVMWAAGVFGFLSIAAGVLLIIARNYLPARVTRGHGFPVQSGDAAVV